MAGNRCGARSNVAKDATGERRITIEHSIDDPEFHGPVTRITQEPLSDTVPRTLLVVFGNATTGGGEEMALYSSHGKKPFSPVLTGIRPQGAETYAQTAISALLRSEG